MVRLIGSTLPGTIERPDLGQSDQTQNQPNWLVVVFDNDKNTFEEVIAILILSTGCTFEEAEIETWEVHHLGKSVVHQADESECHRIAAIISRIGIRVEVTQES